MIIADLVGLSIAVTVGIVAAFFCDYHTSVIGRWHYTPMLRDY